MLAIRILLAGMVVGLGALTAQADIALVITTDSNLNDNGGVDEFVPIPADGTLNTVYIWGAATPGEETVFEFNFDLTPSGAGLSTANATIGTFFAGVGGSLSDTDLGDLQFGWSAFFGVPPSLPALPTYTLFATLDVTIAPGTPAGPDSTIDLAGPDFRIVDPDENPFVVTGTSRVLSEESECVTDEDCDDGAFCNGEETCIAGSCEPGVNPCSDPTPVCCEDTDTCASECCADDECDDGLFCNGTETCVDGECQPGENPCEPYEVCDEDTDTCVELPRPRAICVDWVPSRPDLPHLVYSGATTTVKGIARQDAIEYRWDFGDGSSTAWAPITNPYNLGQSHVYVGAAGQLFAATLRVRDAFGREASDTYRVLIEESSDLGNPDHLDVRIAMSIDEGLWYLHRTLNRATYGAGAPGYGQPYGYWNDPGGYPLPATGTALDAFQLNGSRVNGDYYENPYVETVQRAMNYLLYNTYAFNISPQSAGNPDTNGNGIGLVANASGNLTDSRQTYIGGICMTALASSGAPNVIAAVGRDHVYGRPYDDIVQDMVDFFAFGQIDSGSGRGGWRYYANYGNSDMSTTQWPPLAMLVAERPQPRGMGSIVPQFVRDELINFLNYTQHTACDGNNGGFGYSYNIDLPNCTKAGAGIICHEFLHTPLTDPKVESAIGFLYRHWNDTSTGWDYTRLRGNSYGMYAVMKAMRIPGELATVYGEDIKRITEYDCTIPGQTANAFDWYYTPTGQTNQGLASYIVSTQLADGSWDDLPGPNPVYDAFCTGWRILILSRVFTPQPVAFICNCWEYDLNQDITLDGSCSYHEDRNRTIVEYQWDFDFTGDPDSPDNADFDVDCTGVTCVIPGGFSVEGYYPVALRVLDDNPDQQAGIQCCVIYVHPPPHCPVAVAHPDPADRVYEGVVDRAVEDIDGSASWDPNDDIASYAWDLDGDGEFDDCYEPTCVYTWSSVGEYVIRLEVCDEGGEFPACCDRDEAFVQISPDEVPVCDAGGPYTGCPNAIITLNGSGSYDPNPEDTITFAWDLDNDGEFDDCFEPQCDFPLGPDVGTTYDICLKVTDSYGQSPPACCTTVTVVSCVEGVIFVDVSADGANNGTSWHDAYNDLQDGLADAASRKSVDEIQIWVAAGRYAPAEADGSRDETFQLLNGVGVYGGFAGWESSRDQRDIGANVTILSGDLNGDDGPEFANNGENAHHVVTGSGCDGTAILDGFTITGGNANRNYPRNCGGGLFNAEGSPTVANCRFEANVAYDGAGMHNRDYSSPSVTDCDFVGNLAGQGGAISNLNRSSPPVTNCLFENNLARCWDGGALYCVNYSRPMVLHSVFRGNVANYDGGSVCNLHWSSPRFYNCEFTNELAGGAGGVMYCFNGSQAKMIGCTLSNNTAANGAALAFDSFAKGEAVAEARTGEFWRDNLGKTVHAGRGLVLDCGSKEESTPRSTEAAQGPSNVYVANSIVWDGADGIWNADGSTVTIVYSDVFGGWPGEGNLDADPLFVDAGSGDFHLTLGSPCVDAGSDPLVPAGITTDLDGSPRIVDGNLDGVPVVDMGAYELQGSGLLAGDFNGDGQVDLDDFGVFEGCFSGRLAVVSGDCARCDVNQDTFIDLQDFAWFQRAFRP